MLGKKWLLVIAMIGAGRLTAQSTVSVPFVGCKSDGQLGPQDAPKETRVALPVSRRVAQNLAYYSTGNLVGVLAPRGWFCFGTYGSAGDQLFVSPQPIGAKELFNDSESSDRWMGFSGPAIQISYRFGGTSGRFSVAEVIARVFPKFRSFAEDVMKEFPDDGPSYSFGPFPSDALKYKSSSMVEYRTPPHTEGLGTHSFLKANEASIEGVAILVGEDTDLIQLALRLPNKVRDLSAAIIQQVEREAAPGARPIVPR